MFDHQSRFQGWAYDSPGVVCFCHGFDDLAASDAALSLQAAVVQITIYLSLMVSPGREISPAPHLFTLHLQRESRGKRTTCNCIEAGTRVVMAEAYLCIQLASTLFLAGRWVANRYSARRRRETEDDNKPGAGDTSVEINVEFGPECDTVEGAIMAVGTELAMKTQRKFFGSRTLRQRAITGLSPEFATHRRQMQLGLSELAARQGRTSQALAEGFLDVQGDLRDLSETAASQQSAIQAVADELVGVGNDFRYGTDQLIKGVAAVRTDLDTVIENVEGVRNEVVTGLLEVNHTLRQGTAVIYRSLQDLRCDMGELQLSMDQAREENSLYFQDVSSRLNDVKSGLIALEATYVMREQQKDLSKLQNSLSEAGMYLNQFTGTGGEDLGLLDKAHTCCCKVLRLRPHLETLDAHKMAGIIMVATSYRKHAQLKPPATAKQYVFDSDFLNITNSLKHFWADHTAAHTPTWSNVVCYLLELSSSICLLPPEGLVLGELDPGLVEAFGELCCSQPSLLDRFPEVGGAAWRALLQAKPLDELCRTSNAAEVDISLCNNKADLIQALLDTGKPVGALTQVIENGGCKTCYHRKPDNSEENIGNDRNSAHSDGEVYESEEAKLAASLASVYENKRYPRLDPRAEPSDTAASDMEDFLARSPAW
ncbi:unnamed protein product [Ectocarpus sp. 6 AP-2014]